ncbi:MAG: RagB/SusD family nutrient uptake outer membrane protein [Candidatus Pseudobacter hemicellulosilyticus]|uniref:RagB/SusD family nutrient uptake outer membrane protein n=1 Tax=Candidatus Pseudobacter hemicellulosilyticus TaxID=3121375 RepID=A0AAJ5WXI1_9BACT|nr:MAG: RagB/SusD family nutrient uptake outer membrane protein [Pseudobacter sp.]
MKKIIIIAGCISTFLGACSKSLNIDPEGTMTREQLQEIVKTKPATVLEPMVTSMVSQVNGFVPQNSVDSRNFLISNLLLNLKGNDMVLAHVNGGWLSNDYQMQNYREENATRTALYWGMFYKWIFYANQVLDLIPADFDPSQATETNKLIMKYKASALTMRAFCYTYLLWLYQDDYFHGGKDKAGVPLYTTVAGEEDRAPAQEVWNQVITDATEAVALFKSSGLSNTASRTDFDASVASVVLARAALTTGNWPVAISAAEYVMAAYPTLMNETQYTTSGLSNISLPETIFGYDFSTASGKGTSSFPGWMNILGEGGYGGSQGSWVAIDQRLYDQISATDYRKGNFVADEFIEHQYASSVLPEKHYRYYSYKFAAPAIDANTPSYNQDDIYMRSSEMILTKAEAEARGGLDGDAQNTLYILAHERDPNYVRSISTGDALLAEIRLQRRIELWGESGFEFFDNKRWNIGVDRRGSANHTNLLVVPAGKLFTLQLPLATELNYNPLITEQNPL